MRRIQIVSFVVLLAAAALVLWLASRNPQPPLLPDDETHRETTGPDACLECHAPGKPVPQSERHPFGRDCQRCHGFSR